jgi:DNA-binding protein HU-beta
MNKGELVDKIAAANGVSKTAAAGAIDTIIDAVTGALKKGGRVTLVGFGTFSVSQRKARNGRNPQTGSVIKIAARKVAKFTPGGAPKGAPLQNILKPAFFQQPLQPCRCACDK